MGNRNEIMLEINALIPTDSHALDTVRRKYLKALHEYTWNNVICYYSWWLQKPEANPNAVSINDDDKNWFMNAVYKLDKTKNLDIILHTPWWGISAAESIVHYLRSIFDKSKIRVIIPQMAMSAWTMIACSANKILMWKQSNIWPIDPQIRWMSARWVIEWFQKAKEEIITTPAIMPLRQVLISKYSPDFIIQCIKAKDQTNEIVNKWLQSNMFSKSKKAKKIEQALKVTKFLWDNDTHKEHARHISLNDCKKIWLKVESLEADQTLQDLVLSVHHSYMHTFWMSASIKAIENHLWTAYFKHVPVVQ